MKLYTVKLFVNSCTNTVEKFLTADLKDVEGQRHSSFMFGMNGSLIFVLIKVNMVSFGE